MACPALDFSSELGEQPAVVTTWLPFVNFELDTAPDEAARSKLQRRIC
jgi:hypothetical protein